MYCNHNSSNNNIIIIVVANYVTIITRARFLRERASVYRCVRGDGGGEKKNDENARRTTERRRRGWSSDAAAVVTKGVVVRCAVAGVRAAVLKERGGRVRCSRRDAEEQGGVRARARPMTRAIPAANRLQGCPGRARPSHSEVRHRRLCACVSAYFCARARVRACPFDGGRTRAPPPPEKRVGVIRTFLRGGQLLNYAGPSFDLEPTTPSRAP